MSGFVYCNHCNIYILFQDYKYKKSDYEWNGVQVLVKEELGCAVSLKTHYVWVNRSHSFEIIYIFPFVKDISGTF